jgi:hypothetical protein
MDISKYNRDMAFRDLNNKMPYLQFPARWSIRMLWPFGGAAARFVVKKGDAEVSVYADFDDSLGCMGKPYWEIYPYDGDTWRCWINEGDELIKAISVAIGKQEARKT